MYFAPEMKSKEIESLKKVVTVFGEDYLSVDLKFTHVSSKDSEEIHGIKLGVITPTISRRKQAELQKLAEMTKSEREEYILRKKEKTKEYNANRRIKRDNMSPEQKLEYLVKRSEKTIKYAALTERERLESKLVTIENMTKTHAIQDAKRTHRQIRNRYLQLIRYEEEYGKTQCQYCGRTILKHNPSQTCCLPCQILINSAVVGERRRKYQDNENFNLDIDDKIYIHRIKVIEKYWDEYEKYGFSKGYKNIHSDVLQDTEVCIVCGKEFRVGIGTGHYPGAKVCSRACRNHMLKDKKARARFDKYLKDKKKAREKATLVKPSVCVVCGKKYFAGDIDSNLNPNCLPVRHFHTITCSKECSKIRKHQKHDALSHPGKYKLVDNRLILVK